MSTAFHSDHHARLNRLAGFWDTEITTLDAEGREQGTSRATDEYVWLPNGHFLVHNVDAQMDGERVQSTEIFGVNADAGNFYSRSYDADGSTHDFTAQIDGPHLTIEGQQQRFAGHFGDSGQTLQGEWKQRSNGAWVPFVSITLRKRV